MKLNFQLCSAGETSESIKNGGKLFKKVKKPRLHIDKELYKTARYMVHKLIFNKKKTYLEDKLSGCIGKPNKLRKALKFLSLPNNTES